MFDFGNEALGLSFVGLAVGLTFLMYYLWGFPFNKATNRSEAPRVLVNVHRLFGYVFVAIYIYLMWDMIPRLWSYQVELPARTVAHLLLGMTIGALLFVKLVIVRFFKHMEARLAPALGTGLLVCTLLLLGLALPTTLREAFLKDSALMGGNLTTQRLARVREQLPKAGIEDDALLDRLATVPALYAGRSAMMAKCVQCHDLRTILARPRTPDEWRRTVGRMADRSSVVNFITADEQLLITAYLVAISPTLQSTVRQRREQTLATAQTQKALVAAMSSPSAEMAVDLTVAKATFEDKCSQCHSVVLVEARPPADEAAAKVLVARMVRNGLRAGDDELRQVIAYLAATYGEAPVPSAAMPSSASVAMNPDTPVNPDTDDAASRPGVVAKAVIDNSDKTPGTSQTVTSIATSTAAPTSVPVDQVLVLSPAGTELRFENPDLTAKAGTRLRVTLENKAESGQSHNFVLVREEAAYDEVSSAALGAPGGGFAPDHPQVLASIPAQMAGSSESVEFTAPAPGRYRFGCMMPGHSFTMSGTLNVQ